jgi:hypothetical protein
MAKVNGSHLKAGAAVWTTGYIRGVGKVPVKLIVVNGAIESSNRLEVTYDNPADATTHAASMDYENKKFFVFLGDRGVKPYNYDSRVPQLFTTKSDLELAIKAWDGKNPNFIYE